MSEKVKLAQELLTAKNYPCEVDDDWGPETQRQLGAFQYEHDLRDNEAPLPSGVTEHDLAALQKAPSWARGIDVARYQLIPDFAKVKASGISFCFAKCSGSDGKSEFYKDATFARNWPALKAAGIIRGAYHFHSFEDDPREQAQRFFERVGPLEPGDLPPALDVENRSHPIKKRPAIAHIRACLEEIERLFGVTPFLYTSAGVLQAHRIDTPDAGLERYPLWVPRYETSIASVEKSVPACYPGKRAWKIWQVGFDDSLSGIKPEVDRNFFQGTLEELQRFTVR